MTDWQQEAIDLYLTGKTWAQMAERFKDEFPNLTILQTREKVRDFVRTQPEYKQRQAQPPQQSSIEYKADGTIISEKFITCRDGQEMTPDFILTAHGLKAELWEMVSYKHNTWNSQLKGGILQISFQSKLTAKPRQNAVSFEDIDEHFKNLDRNYKPLRILPPKQEGDLIAEVNIADLHYGRLCWVGDTGNNFDYKIARGIYQQMMSDICNELKGKNIEYISFPIGNDLINSDTPEKTTTAGTPQDTDVRWQKLLDTATDMVIAGIDMLKDIAPVKAFYIASNHDEVTTYGLVSTVNAWFRNDNRVEIDKAPISRKYRLYGNTLVGYSHGNTEKPKDGTKYRLSKLAALVPLEARQMWANAKYCEFHAAHLHSEHAIEELNGVIVRRVSSPTAMDTWTFEGGYVGAVRKAQVFLYDKEKGLKQIINIPV